jgi:hypothetical protein
MLMITPEDVQRNIPKAMRWVTQSEQAPLYSENHIYGLRRWIDEKAAVDLLFRIGVPGNRTEVQGRFQDD